MAFKWLFWRKRHGNSWENEETQAEALARSEEIKGMRHTARLLQHQLNIKKEQYKLRQLQDQIDYYEQENAEDEPEKEDPMQAFIMTMLLNALQGKSNPSGENLLSFIGGSPRDSLRSVPNSQPSINPTNKLVLSESEIQAQIQTIPKKYLKMAKTMPPDVIKSYIRQNFDYDDSTIDKAIAIIKR